tara:strand:- start:1049 stop:1708 length:660 start_codon:yes stop_codon:yes gene_type:complete
MSWRYTNEQLAAMSRGQYQSLQDNPWKETGIDNIFLSRRPEDESGFDEFGEESALDNIMGDINAGLIGDIEKQFDRKELKQQTIIFNTTSTDATKGILEETLVTKIFFSPANVKSIQDSIRFYVFKETNDQISHQSDEQLYVIMRAISLQFGNFVTSEPVKEVKRLNIKVIDRCVKDIVTELKQYRGYIDDLAKLPTPLENPHYANKNNFTYNISNLPE